MVRAAEMDAAPMRIGIFTWTAARLGGTETYLDHIMTELHDRGHEIAFLCETDDGAEDDRIRIPEGVPVWTASRTGTGAALGSMQAWAPDVIYSHGSAGAPTIEGALPAIAPSVFFAHDYHGTCISGAKTFRVPTTRPCSRAFGPACLVHYFPRRCGGRNPVTMWRQYEMQAARLAALRRYDRIVVVSRHMRDEYIRHGFDPEQVRVIPYVAASPGAQAAARRNATSVRSGARAGGGLARLLFVGRMDATKGGEILLAALPAAAAALDRRLHLTFVGDGPARVTWERAAAEVRHREPRVSIEFTGWQSRAAVAEKFEETDLLVVPSQWPEPFGRVGPEGAEHGVPAAAFDVGGVREWLVDGETGVLAPGDPPTSGGLAQAIIRAIGDPAVRERLSAGARALSGRFTTAGHLAALVPLLAEVATTRRGAEIAIEGAAARRATLGITAH
jgi:glycosyltransferase involved in cell wall biosynthesis